MSFLQLLLLLRKLPFRDLMNYPDELRDKQGVRRWLVAVSEAGVVLSDLTDTEIDDTIIDAFAEVVNNESLFLAIYDIVLNVFDHEEDATMYNYFKHDVGIVAAKVGFSPAVIIGIIQLVVMLLKFIRERRN